MTEQEAKDKLLSFQKGHDVIVIGGRKHPKGLRGTVRWMGDGDYGPSIGFSVPGEQKLRYTSPHNLQVIFPGLDPGDEPERGWVALLEEVRAGTTEPKKGNTVRFEGTTGEVFWARDGRVGFKDSQSPNGEGLFKNLDELHLLLPDGTWVPCVKFVRAVPTGKKPAPSGFVDLSLEDEEKVSQKPPLLETYGLDKPLDLPSPFSEITHFTRKAGEKFFSARGKNEEEICTLPEDTVWGLLPDLNLSDPLNHSDPFAEIPF